MQAQPRTFFHRPVFLLCSGLAASAAHPAWRPTVAGAWYKPGYPVPHVQYHIRRTENYPLRRAKYVLKAVLVDGHLLVRVKLHIPLTFNAARDNENVTTNKFRMCACKHFLAETLRADCRHELAILYQYMKEKRTAASRKGPLHRCSKCPSEWQVEVCRIHGFFHLTTYELVVTCWFDIGSSFDPEGTYWEALTGCGFGDYDKSKEPFVLASLPNISWRFEAHVPGRVTNLD